MFRIQGGAYEGRIDYDVNRQATRPDPTGTPQIRLGRVDGPVLGFSGDSTTLRLPEGWR